MSYQRAQQFADVLLLLLVIIIRYRGQPVIYILAVRNQQKPPHNRFTYRLDDRVI